MLLSFWIIFQTLESNFLEISNILADTFLEIFVLSGIMKLGSKTLVQYYFRVKLGI